MVAAAEVLRRRTPPGLQYLGIVSYQDTISGAALATAVALNSGTNINSTGGFLKFIDEGKEILVARLPFKSSISWDQLNAAKLIKGEKQISIQGHQYKVRLLTGGNGDPSSAAGGEWNKYMYSVSAGRPASYNGPIFENYADNVLLIGNASNIRSTLCQEIQAGVSANCIRRGRTSVDWYGGIPRNDNGTTVYWRPVLEKVS